MPSLKARIKRYLKKIWKTEQHQVQTDFPWLDRESLEREILYVNSVVSSGSKGPTILDYLRLQEIHVERYGSELEVPYPALWRSVVPTLIAIEHVRMGHT